MKNRFLTNIGTTNTSRKPAPTTTTSASVMDDHVSLLVMRHALPEQIGVPKAAAVKIAYKRKGVELKRTNISPMKVRLARIERRY